MKLLTNTIGLILREFRLLWSNSVLRVIFLGAPVVYALLLGSVYRSGKVTELPVVLVDADRSPLSARAADMLEENETLHIAAVLSGDEDPKEEMLRSNAALAVYIPENFEADILQRRYPEVRIDVNMANVLTANFATRAVQTSLGTLNAGLETEALKKSGVPASEALSRFEPFRISYVRNGNPSGNYMNFLWPGMLLTVLQQVLLLAAALTFAWEWEHDTFRTELMGRARFPLQALLAKIIPYWLGAWAILGFFILAHQIMDVPLSASMLRLLLPANLFILAVLCMGILVSIWIPAQLKATELLMVVATPSFVLSGYTWPLEQMPQAIQWIAQAIPLTPFLEIFRKVWVSEASLAQVQGPLQVLWIQLAVYGVLAWFSLQYKYYKIKKNNENG